VARLRLGVLGGTFDPVHMAHLILAEQAREQLHLERVLFVPAGDPWRKADRRVTAAHHRLAMTRLAVAGNPAFLVDSREVARQGPTYTVDTLRELAQEHVPADELFFLLGEDALSDLPFWRDPGGIAALAWLVVAPRQGAELPQLPFDSSRLLRLDMPYIAISSTDLRARAAAGASLRYLVPEPVREYIAAQALYRDA
jgi:nicotinate-nucleotide adenylyltransferase